MKTDIQYYYKTRLGTVRDSKPSDVFELAPNVRKEDLAEIWKSHHVTAETALFGGFVRSVLCYTVERNEKTIAMFGIVPQTVLGSTAAIWLLASDELEKVQRTFAKHSKWFIRTMLDCYPVLINYVDVENKKSIAWLKWCGATMGQVVPYGIEQKPFQYFEFRRK